MHDNFAIFENIAKFGDFFLHANVYHVTKPCFTIFNGDP